MAGGSTAVLYLATRAAGSLPSLQATSLEQQLGRDIRLRRVATSGGLGPLSLGASRASANEREIALRQLYNAGEASYACPMSKDFGRGWVALDRRFCRDVV